MIPATLKTLGKRCLILNYVLITGILVLMSYSEYLDSFYFLMPSISETQWFHFLFVVGFLPIIWAYAVSISLVFKFWK